MKVIFRSIFLLALAFSSSCAVLTGDKNDTVSIASIPSGANIFIEGVNYGQTPATIKIEAKNSTVVLTKEGYGSTKIELEAWATMKSKACSADALTMILPWSVYSVLWSGYCNEFKKKEHFVTIPNLSSSLNSNSNSVMGLGKAPVDMINYYYNQQNNQNQYLAPRQQPQQQRQQFYGQ